MNVIKLLAVTFLFFLTVTGIFGCRAEKKITLNVSAGAGLTDAITEINIRLMEQNHDLKIQTNFAAAGDLQTQIENGAPTDIFIPSAAWQMNTLEEKGLILPETRRDIAGNKLVLIVHKDSSLNISSFEDLLKSDIKLIAMGDPGFVPAGSYGLLAFELLGITYDELKPKLVLAGNVRQVLSYVENKNADTGVVYASDAFNSDKVRVVATAPDEINEIIVFPAAVISSSKNAEVAKAYIDFLGSREAQEILKKHGFIISGNLQSSTGR